MVSTSSGMGGSASLTARGLSVLSSLVVTRPIVATYILPRDGFDVLGTTSLLLNLPGAMSPGGASISTPVAVSFKCSFTVSSTLVFTEGSNPFALSVPLNGVSSVFSNVASGLSMVGLGDSHLHNS